LASFKFRILRSNHFGLKTAIFQILKTVQDQDRFGQDQDRIGQDQDLKKWS